MLVKTTVSACFIVTFLAHFSIFSAQGAENGQEPAPQDAASMLQQSESGNQSEEEAPAEAALLDPSSVRLIVCRPNSYGYDGRAQDMGLAAACEALLYYKLGAVPQLEIVDREELYSVVGSYRDFGRRVTRQRYASAVSLLLATHLLYIEYEASSDKEGTLYLQLISASDRARVVGTRAQISWGNIDRPITDAVLAILSAFNISEDEIPAGPVAGDILGTDAKKAERLGRILLKEYGSDATEQEKLARQCVELSLGEQPVELAAYVGAVLFARAGRFGDALEQIQRLTAGRKSHPRLYLLQARIARRAGRLEEARKSIERVVLESHLVDEYLWEQGRILESVGDIRGAYEIYKKLLDRGQVTLDVYIRIAVVCYTLRHSEECKSYLQSIAAWVNTTAVNDYCDKIGALLQSEGLPESDAVREMLSACRADSVAPVLTVLGQDPVVINAGEPFVDLGARAVDNVDGDISEQVSVSGTIDPDTPGRYVVRYDVFDRAGNTASTTRTVQVNVMHVPRPAGQDVDPLLTASRPEEPPLRRALRIATGVLAGGCLAGGLAMNFLAASRHEEYREADASKVDDLHDVVAQMSLARTALYIVGGVSALGFTVNIAIPKMAGRKKTQTIAGVD